MVGEWEGRAYPALLQSRGRRGWAGSLAAFALVVWFASSAWNLICVASLRFLCSMLLWLWMLEDHSFLRGIARGDRKTRRKLGSRWDTRENEDKAASNVELGCAGRFPLVSWWWVIPMCQSSDFPVLERGSLHSYGNGNFKSTTSRRRAKKRPWPPKEAQSDNSATVRGWRPARQLPPQLHWSKEVLLFCKAAQAKLPHGVILDTWGWTWWQRLQYQSESCTQNKGGKI